jgi:hypothetical protein
VSGISEGSSGIQASVLTVTNIRLGSVNNRRREKSNDSSVYKSQPNGGQFLQRTTRESLRYFRRSSNDMCAVFV